MSSKTIYIHDSSKIEIFDKNYFEQILKSKSNNEHYLNRYIKFIHYLNDKNINNLEKLHKHHICPKAKDMFPEYSNFASHPWNMCKVTKREHILCHLLIYKAFKTKSQCYALNQLCKSKSSLHKFYKNDLKKALTEDMSTKKLRNDSKGKILVRIINSNEYKMIKKELFNKNIHEIKPRTKPKYIKVFHDPETQKEYKIDIRFDIPSNLVYGRSKNL